MTHHCYILADDDDELKSMIIVSNQTFEEFMLTLVIILQQ